MPSKHMAARVRFWVGGGRRGRGRGGEVVRISFYTEERCRERVKTSLAEGIEIQNLNFGTGERAGLILSCLPPLLGR